jgi:transposase
MATVTCRGCLQRDQRIAALERRVAELEALVRDLNARLGSNATNSGAPALRQPPGAPKPVTKKRTGKKPGGQPRHPPRLKRRLPPQRLHKVIPFVPSHCERCQEPLPPHPAPDDSEPAWRQVAELPKLAAQVTEYQGHYRTCPGCGQLNHAPIPQDLKVHSVGPCLAATLGYLAGSRRASNRGLEETTEDVFDVPIALVYDELRKLAAQKLAQEKPGQTLQAAALVHEAYLRLVDV